jgi:hypothetical protein
MKFNELPIEQRLVLMIEYGSYTGESFEFYDYWRHLYMFNSHFIEIWYNTHTRQIEKVVMLNYKDLDKYTDRMILLIR